YRRIFGSLGLPGRQLHFDARTTTVLYVFVTTWLFLKNTGIHLPNSHGNSSSCLECCNFSTGLGQEVFPFKVVGYEKFDEKFLSGKALLFYLHPDGPLTYLLIGYQNENFQDVPPGWAPNISDYPLRLYFEPLKLWYRIYEGDDTMVGPLVAGRLQGKAQRLGMQLRLPRPDGGVDVGSDALVRLSVDEVRDPQNQGVILQHSIPSGIQALCNSLKDAFGVSDQEVVSQSIEAFFEFRRGKMSFQEYAIEFDIRLEEAVTRAGLDLNDVAKFYLFFRGSGLPYKFIEDIKLQLQGDLRRYQEARVLALRLITKKDDSGETFFEDTENNLPAEDGWDNRSWTEDSWSWVEDASPGHQAKYWLDQDFYEPYYDGAYYDESYDDWYENESWTEPWDEQPQGEQEAASSSEPAALAAQSAVPDGMLQAPARWEPTQATVAAKEKESRKALAVPLDGRGYYGYTVEKTLVGSFGESKMSSPKDDINGTPEQTLGEVSLPLKMAELNSTYSAEVIDSGHYLLPVDEQAPLPIDARKNVEQMLFTWSEEIQERWSDFRSSPKTFSTTTEAKRDEARDADSSSNTFSTTTEVERDEARDADSSPETFPTTTEVMTDEARDAGSSSETFSTTTEVHVFKDVSSASGSTKSMSSASGSPVSKPFLDGPDVRTTRTEDFWTLNSEYLTRRHKVARRILFTPNCAIDCPIERSQIQGRRVTEIHYVPRNAAGRVLEDNWITATAPNYDLGSLWTGTTRFRLQPPPLPPRPSAAMATDVHGDGLEPDLFPSYSGDEFPDHWSEDRRERARHYYRAIPEEFYTTSGRRPITPKNVSAWVKKAAGKSLRFQFWELCSGSGRLSLCLLMAQFMVGFPVDYRYSWDIGYAPHQALLQQVHRQFSPDHLFASPSCTPWSVASASKDKARRDEERRSELPTLELLHDMSLSQRNQDRDFTLEQPHSSAMLRESPIVKLLNHSGVRIQRMDQCMLGATDELQRPVRKATAFLSNRRAGVAPSSDAMATKGPHGELQGRFKGFVGHPSCGQGLYVSYLAEDITGPFKFLARSGDYSRVSLEVHSSLTIRPEPQLYLKAAMMQLIESCLEIFQATTSRDYDHWLSDPVLLRVFQDVFHEIMSVLGVLVSLRPWHRKVPDPYLSSACAPMRLLISGEIRSWKIHGLEDMRVLSHHQLHAPVEEADWHVHLFGFCQDDPDVDRDVLGSSSEPKILKPLFDFKKVYKRLQSEIVQTDPVTAKRLLLGLHERFYHCPITDFENMLLRAGLSSDILPLAEEAVMICSICRKYVRLPDRPQIKIGSAASSFNHRVQIDLFMHKDTWILLNVDEATRYKTATAVKSREHQELLNSMFLSWFSIFGPPAQLVMDQETSLMGHEAGRELERFNVERVPKGTTAGPAGHQHTGAGLVERHVGLMEITMMKLEAELDRQGIAITIGDLAKEAAMAHNISLNYGGATPSMCVFGVIPRPFYQDDSTGISTAVGALQTDVAPLEKVIRVRQMALSMVQRAVAKDRIARANRTRTRQLKISELGDVGWRGPAELLKINKDEGAAILSYQGRPYLVSLRHIRPHQAGVFVFLNKEQVGDLMELKHLTEKLSPYKIATIGWVPEKKGELVTWRRASTSSLAYSEVWPKIMRLASGLSRHNAGGAMIGQGVRQIQPPMGSCGVLLLWSHGDSEHASHEHNNDKPIALKKYFVNIEYRPEKAMRVVPSEGATEIEDDEDVNQDSSGNKRKGRLGLLLDVIKGEQVITKAQHNLVNLYWAMHWTQAVPTDFPMVWYGCDNNVQLAQWDIFMSRAHDASSVPEHQKKPYVFTWPAKHFEELYADLSNGEIYKVDDEADNITEDECYDIWPQVEEADAAEIKQFVETSSFQKMHVNSLTSETVIIDSVWVRKWKRVPDGSRKVKSRLCARGCFDKQKDLLTTLKPVYGLSDAPLAWQLCLHGHFESQGGVPSLMDENLFYWRDKNSGRTTSLVTTHVDDCGTGGKKEWLARQLQLLQEKFGKVTRQVLPFNHCGVLYERIPNGFRMSQDSFALKLKPAEIASARKDDELLSPSEVTMFRSILGGLLWVTATWLDLIAEVCALQAQVTRAKVAHLRQANGVVKRARQEAGQGMGLYFQKLVSPLRLACVHDSSAAGNVRNYAQEGILVLLCEDRMGQFDRGYEHVLDDKQCQAGTLVSVRLAELLYSPRPPTLQSLIAQQERGVEGLPIDSYTDCRDFFELASGDKNAPQDKNQRLYVLSFREARMSGRVRWMCLTPTESMTADALTKTMIAEPMMKLLTTGTVQFYNQEKHKMTLRALPRMDYIEGHHFDMHDHELIKMITKPAASVTACVAFVKPRFLCLAILATTASATTTSPPSTSTTSASYDVGWKWMITMVAIIIAAERRTQDAQDSEKETYADLLRQLKDAEQSMAGLGQQLMMAEHEVTATVYNDHYREPTFRLSSLLLSRPAELFTETVNGERGRDPHIGVHGITSAGSELFEIVADGDIVRLQVDFCRKNDAPALRFVRGDGAESISPGQSGMEGVSEQVHFPAPPTTLAGHRLFNSEEGQWKAGDEIRPPTLPTGWSYEFPSFATGLCTAKVLRVQRKVPSKAACEKNCGESSTCHFFAFSAGSLECRYFPACDLDRMNATADFTTYKKKLSCATAIATAAEAALSPALPGTKTRHQCQAACSWQGSSFTEW
ncbi:RE1, partial [Symbiodinium sp. CCMP2456]